MQQIALSEATAARRRIHLVCLSEFEKAPLPGLTFSGSDIKVAKNSATENDFTGSVTEIAGGAYYYEAAVGELNTRGFLQLRSNKAGVIFQGYVVAVQVGAEAQNAEGLFNLTDGVEPGLKFKEAMQSIWATTSGKSAGAGSGTITYRNKADTLNRVTATVASNNRTAMAYNFTV